MNTEFFNGRARLIPVCGHEDARGLLSPFDFPNLPFEPRRVFAVSNVPQGEVRGGHAHKYGEQLLVCVQGRLEILMRSQDAAETLILRPATPALLVGAGIWCQQTYLSEGTVLLVFASHPYDAGCYLTGWG